MHNKKFLFKDSKKIRLLSYPILFHIFVKSLGSEEGFPYRGCWNNLQSR